MKGNAVNWIIFLLLALIWGSSFILMKQGLKGLSAMQVASIRMVSAGIILLPIAFKHYKKIPQSTDSLTIIIIGK